MDHHLKVGDYVLATKYRDGDPQDHFCVGYYAEALPPIDPLLSCYLVVDESGMPFRASGFRRVQRISRRRGAWLISHLPLIESAARAGCKRSVWGWARLPYSSPLWSFTPVAQ